MPTNSSLYFRPSLVALLCSTLARIGGALPNAVAPRNHPRSAPTASLLQCGQERKKPTLHYCAPLCLPTPLFTSLLPPPPLPHSSSLWMKMGYHINRSHTVFAGKIGNGKPTPYFRQEPEQNQLRNFFQPYSRFSYLDRKIPIFLRRSTECLNH